MTDFETFSAGLGVTLNTLPEKAGLVDGELMPGDVLDVTLKKSNRVRKGSRGKTYRIVFHRVGVVGATHDQEEIGLADAVRSKKHDAGWVLEGYVGGEDGILQGFHDWSIRGIERA